MRNKYHLQVPTRKHLGINGTKFPCDLYTEKIENMMNNNQQGLNI